MAGGRIGPVTAISQRSRPSTFAQVIGQDHVTGLLAEAVRQNRLGHAYLFSGPRGVGKTTSARLLAMAATCSAEGDRPCGECEDCRLVASGAHPDVIELDAASNNSVDDIRDLREKAGLASMRGGSRVWILDEAHMLSRAAANALLKTLEEPPPHLIFVLATTEPEKLPPTVLSRCQHYRFRRLSDQEIHSKLLSICDDAGATADEGALELVARSAEGAMRDAESLLERLLAPGAHISLQAVTSALGLPPAERLQELAEALAGADVAGALELAAGLYHDGFSPRTLAERLAVTLRDALVNGLADGDGFRLKLDSETLMRMIATLDDEHERFSRRDDLFSLEVVLIKVLGSQQAPEPQEQPVTRTAPRVREFDPLARPARRKPDAGSSAPAADASKTPAASTSDGRRPSFHHVREKAGGQLRAFLAPARDSIDGNTITLDYPDHAGFHQRQLSQRLDELAAIVADVFGPGHEIKVNGPGGAAPAKKA